ncbi:MAG: efflux RND transporter periplasmic adaptor subunit [Nitrospirae bacterium]|nr:efflux RND transporter periplasmic adaptor subunit [Nitrospirota bacterium]MCL5285191.1 efflux RND transporter periplasmic adaptor subunit [Nitrospirota bacterium]
MNRKFISLVVVLSLAAGVAIGAIGVRWFFHTKNLESKDRRSPGQSGPTILYWRNPMNASIHSDHPMKDNMGMDYIPVYAEPSESNKKSVSVDPRIRQTLGIRVVPVVRRTFSRTIHAAATVGFDRHRSRTVSTRFRGFIQELSVRAPGDAIRKNDLLARVYSPELASTEDEALIALGATRADPASGDNRKLFEAARERLRLLGVPDSEIDRLEKTGKPQSVIPVRSPYSGTVSSISVRVGGAILPGMTLMTLEDLTRVWVDVALYPAQLAWVKPGDRVALRVPAMPSRIYRGILRFADPELNGKSRTVRARVLVDNPDGFLKPGMYLEATLHPDPLSNVLVIPREALIRTGTKTVVITEIGRGHFRPASVTVGARSSHWVEVLSGLFEGDKVVVSGEFLLDAESRFENVSERMAKGGRP